MIANAAIGNKLAIARYQSNVTLRLGLHACSRVTGTFFLCWWLTHSGRYRLLHPLTKFSAVWVERTVAWWKSASLLALQPVLGTPKVRRKTEWGCLFSKLWIAYIIEGDKFISDQCMHTLGSQQHLGTLPAWSHTEMCILQSFTLDWFRLAYSTYSSVANLWKANENKKKNKNLKLQAKLFWQIHILRLLCRLRVIKRIHPDL